MSKTPTPTYWKFLHKPTGLFYGPKQKAGYTYNKVDGSSAKKRGRFTNLSKDGKVYARKPTFKQRPWYLDQNGNKQPTMWHLWVAVKVPAPKQRKTRKDKGSKVGIEIAPYPIIRKMNDVLRTLEHAHNKLKEAREHYREAFGGEPAKTPHHSQHLSFRSRLAGLDIELRHIRNDIVSTDEKHLRISFAE